MMIYALLDVDTLKKYNISFEEFIDKCYELDATIIQYRNKNASLEKMKQDLAQIRQLWTKTLIANDYLELGKCTDGIHIGQDDLKKFGSIQNIRKIVKDKIIGLSTHNKKEILEANEMDINYIGLGAYRATSTKNVSSIKGKELEELALLSKHPVAIIGGVKLDDKIKNVTYKVIGSDICKSISTQ